MGPALRARERSPAASASAQVTPKGDLVLLKVAPAEEKTAGGIILPDSVRKVWV